MKKILFLVLLTALVLSCQLGQQTQSEDNSLSAIETDITKASVYSSHGLGDLWVESYPVRYFGSLNDFTVTIKADIGNENICAASLTLYYDSRYLEALVTYEEYPEGVTYNSGFDFVAAGPSPSSSGYSSIRRKLNLFGYGTSGITSSNGVATLFSIRFRPKKYGTTKLTFGLLNDEDTFIYNCYVSPVPTNRTPHGYPCFLVFRSSTYSSN